MAKRETVKIPAKVTAEQYQAAMAQYAVSDSIADKTTAKMNGEITRVREKYDAILITALQDKEKQMEIIQGYCIENKDTLFVNKRHIENAHGIVGFRMGTPALKTLPKWTWAKVLEKVEAIMPEFVRTKKEVNKDALLDRRAEEGVAAHLQEIGVYVGHDESFYIELKKEEVAEVK